MKEESIRIFIMIKLQKEGSHYIYLSVVLMDPVFKMGKNYYSHLSLKRKGCRQKYA